MFEAAHLQNLLSALEPLWEDPDKYRQRAAAECLLGLVRGSKHWSKESLASLWEWFEPRLDRIFAQLKPDTVTFWDSMFHVSYAATFGFNLVLTTSFFKFRVNSPIVTREGIESCLIGP